MIKRTRNHFKGFREHFMSRNNDISGFSAFGVLYDDCIKNSTKQLHLDILNPSRSNCSENLLEYVQQVSLAHSHLFDYEYLKEFEVNIFFKLSHGPTRPSWKKGDYFKAVFKIKLQNGLTSHKTSYDYCYPVNIGSKAIEYRVYKELKKSH